MTRAGFYRVVGRIMSPVGIAGLRVWGYVSSQERARIIVVNERQEMLFVKGTISDWHWSFPGGGIEKGEDAKTAAVRELYEEIGIRVAHERVTKVGVVQKGDDGIPYTAHIFTVEVLSSSLPKEPVNVREIAEITWLNRNVAPDQLSKVAQKAIKLLPK